MDLVAELRNSRVGDGSVFLQFLLHYKRNEKVVYLFFEAGEDEAFYINHIVNQIKPDWSYISYPCNNKKAVYEVHRKIGWGAIYSRRRALFFVDKDLSDLIPETLPKDTNIFVTEYYSIENYVTNQDVLIRVVRELCNFTNTSQIGVLSKKFTETQKRFYKKCISFMAWILLMRRAKQKLQLNNVDLSKLFYLDNELNIFKKKNFINTVRKLTGITANYSRTELVSAINELKRCPSPKHYVRGKFDLWMFVVFANEIPKTLNGITGSAHKTVKMSVNLSPRTALKVLATRTKIPALLYEFLQRNLY